MITSRARAKAGNDSGKRFSSSVRSFSKASKMKMKLKKTRINSLRSVNDSLTSRICVSDVMDVDDDDVGGSSTSPESRSMPSSSAELHSSPVKRKTLEMLVFFRYH